MSAAIFAAYGSHNYMSQDFHKSLPSPLPNRRMQPFATKLLAVRGSGANPVHFGTLAGFPVENVNIFNTALNYTLVQPSTFSTPSELHYVDGLAEHLS